MYDIIFYHSKNEKSEIEEYLDELAEKLKQVKQTVLTEQRYSLTYQLLQNTEQR